MEVFLIIFGLVLLYLAFFLIDSSSVRYLFVFYKKNTKLDYYSQDFSKVPFFIHKGILTKRRAKKIIFKNTISYDVDYKILRFDTEKELDYYLNGKKIRNYKIKNFDFDFNKVYSGKVTSGKSILIEKERAFFEKLQKSNSKEDVKKR